MRISAYSNLPDGVQYRVLAGQGARVTVTLEAGMEAKEGTFEISVETDVRQPVGVFTANRTIDPSF